MWSFVGNFNAIIGAHEHQGRNSLARNPMFDFKNWSNSNNLIHIPTSGATFTGSNKRDSPYSIERRLDRCIGNLMWFDVYNQIFVSTLKMIRSDHFPLLFEFHVNIVCVVSQFKFLKTWSLNKDCRKSIEL